MTKNEANSKFTEVVKLLGLEATYFSGMYTVRIPGEMSMGTMTAEAWLEHIRNCMKLVKRS